MVSAECNCGWGGAHDPDNPRCDLNREGNAESPRVGAIGGELVAFMSPVRAAAWLDRILAKIEAEFGPLTVERRALLARRTGSDAFQTRLVSEWRTES